MASFQKIYHTNDLLLPNLLVCGFLQFESLSTVLLESLVYTQTSKDNIGLSFFGTLPKPRTTGSLVYIQMYRLPDAEEKLREDRDFFESRRKKWVRIPEGMKFEPRMLTPQSVPESWKHDAFPLAARHIVHIYQNEHRALLLRFVHKSGNLLDQPLYFSVLAGMRILEDQWELEVPICEMIEKTVATDEPLPQDVAAEIPTAIAKAYQYLELSPQAAPDAIQESIYNAVNDIIARKVKVKNRTNLAVELGCLWGQTLCETAGWEWRTVLFPGEEPIHCLVNPDRSHIVSPMGFMLDTLKKKGPEAANTSLLLYNMLVGKATGDTPPRAYKWLS